MVPINAVIPMMKYRVPPPAISIILPPTREPIIPERPKNVAKKIRCPVDCSSFGISREI